MADYAYCHNDPVNHVDLLGLQTVVVEQPQMPGLQDLVDAAERAKRQKLLFEASIAFQDAYGKANGDGIAHLRVIREALAGRRTVTQYEINSVLKKGVPRGVDPVLYRQSAQDFLTKSVAAAKALKAQEVRRNPHIQKLGEIMLATIETPENVVNMFGGNDVKMLIFGTTDPLNPDRIDGTWEDRTMAGAGVLLIAVPSARGARMVDGSFDLARGSRTFANAPNIRALKLPATDYRLAGTNWRGYTLANGEVFLQPGLTRTQQAATLRHEGVHSFLSVADDAPLASLRQDAMTWGYNNSAFLNGTEEILAEAIASGSLRQGWKHAFNGAYRVRLLPDGTGGTVVSPWTWGAEGAAWFGGTAVFGYGTIQILDSE